MQTDELIRTLGYSDSAHFLRPDDFGQAPEQSHIFRRAFKSCGVRGVYLLGNGAINEVSAPAVYVAEADSAATADEIHRKVWNQNVVPFLLVRTPQDVRLYSGFHYLPRDRTKPQAQRGVLEASVAFEDVLDRLRDLQASAIDDGTVWRSRGRQIDPTKRVDWRLLDNLRALGRWLRIDTKLPAPVAHALIGKFVYLRYLRDRNILSDRKLSELGTNPELAFSRNATVEGVRTLVDQVDTWLNGSVFPISFSGKNAPTTEHVRRVAGVFSGDDPQSGQLHLDFRAYDFSFIPVETLSVIYEQFLSAADANHMKGAYYTPIHLVNFMLRELNGMRPLDTATSVLDPSCGSGAFLVQCFRRLVECHRTNGGKLRPSDLRSLLVSSIFGVDRDEDACQVTALSLLLAMLDYLDPPDLQSTPQFKLPNLIGKNVFVADFFESRSQWASHPLTRRYDWVVGNPPWIQAGRKVTQEGAVPARVWMDAHATTRPVTNHDVAEAFAWKVMDHVLPNGVVGLLLPAMTLFKESTTFRMRFFADHAVAAVANFTNFRRDLFVRAESPAVALFIKGSQQALGAQNEIAVFSPLVANQETNRTRPGTRHEPWVITVDSSEVQQISRDAIRNGEMLPWKIAMWGGPRDMHLLKSLRGVPILREFLVNHDLAISEGLQLRDGDDQTEETEPVEVAGRPKLNVNALKNIGRLYDFPPNALEEVSAAEAFARLGRARLPLSICQPPHIIISGARTFATFSSRFIVVPPRQIGISGQQRQSNLLKALALYLNSDFITYHEFLTSSQGGVREGRSTLAALREVPAPLDRLSPTEVIQWAKLYDDLAETQRKLWQGDVRPELPQRLAPFSALRERILVLEREANEATATLLGLTEEEQVLVKDLVQVRRRLADGLVPDDLVRMPESDELESYARRLERTLDDAIDEGETRRHTVVVVKDRASAMVQIRRAQTRAAHRVLDASEEVASSLAGVRRRMTSEQGQWLYFDRNLFLFEDNQTFILKPLHRLSWTESQALADADHLVATALAPREGDI
jgi:hypothetical protein